MDREVFEQLKEEAGRARETFQDKETSGINMDGAFTMAPSRAQMRKVEDLQTKEFYVKKVLRSIEEQGTDVAGIIPHPLAWQIDIVDDTVYAFTIDGKKVECAFPEKEQEREQEQEKDICVHRLTVDEETLIDSDRQISFAPKKDQRLIVLASAIGILLLFVLIYVIGSLAY